MHPRGWLALRSFGLLGCLALAAAAPAQDRENPVLRVDGLIPGALRTSVTESWGTFDLRVTNFSDRDRLARVLMFYADRPDVQYGRDVWVPAKSSLVTWLLAGPIAPDEEARSQPKLKPKGAPAGPSLARARELQWLLYDRTDGRDQLILPRGEDRIRSRVIPYRPREAYTTILFDPESSPPPRPGALPAVPLRAEDALLLMRAFRATRELSPVVTMVPLEPLPPSPEAFEGIDHFVLAGNRLANDPAGLRALRRWVEGGGHVWVMLDMVDLEAVAPLLGDVVDFQIVDRVSLTDFQIQTHVAGPVPAHEEFRQRHERPVDFVRVLLPDSERPRNTVDGYPVWFTRDLGRGKVVFTTLGARGWYRPRTPRDPKSPYDIFPELPVPLPALELVSEQLQAIGEDAFRPEAFRKTLTEEIGYQVVSRSTVALVFAGFLLGTLLLGLAARRVGRGELLGWLAPLAALVAAGAFVGLGERSRRPVPPTVAQGQIVDAVPGAPEVAVRGLLAIYRPDPGPAPMGASRGGLFDVDTKGIQGQTQRLMLTDADAWHWENLSLPAGVRFGSFRQTVPTPRPVIAVARFGPDGVEGRLTAAPFDQVEDALVRTPAGWGAGRDVSVRLSPDGTFRAGSGDILPQRHFLAGTLLTDLQQRRQELYRLLLDPETREAAKASGASRDHLSLTGKAAARHLEGKSVLLAWAKAADTHFDLVPEARHAGSALLVVPMSFERPPPGSRVTIPGPFVAFQRVRNGLPMRLTTEGRQEVDMHLRFQLPPEVLPLAVARARLNFRVDAPSRRVRVSALPDGKEDGERAEVYSGLSPLDPVRVEITDPRLLRLDEAGGLHLTLELRNAAKPGGKAPAGKKSRPGGLTVTPAEDEKWTIHYLEVEVAGKTSS